MFSLGAAIGAIVFLVSWWAQTPVRKDSVQVSAGLSKEQLAAETKLNAVLKEGKEAMARGDVQEAIKKNELARDMVSANKLLVEQEDNVLRDLGSAYIQAQLFPKADEVFTRQLTIHGADCRADSHDPSSCADVQCGLGMAEMGEGEFAKALAVLRKAEANYGRAAGPSEREEFQMIEKMNQGKSRLLLAVALFRTGDPAAAEQMTKNAIEQLTGVQGNNNIQESIRANARLYLKNGQQQLEQLQRLGGRATAR